MLVYILTTKSFKHSINNSFFLSHYINQINHLPLISFFLSQDIYHSRVVYQTVFNKIPINCSEQAKISNLGAQMKTNFEPIESYLMSLNKFWTNWILFNVIILKIFLSSFQCKYHLYCNFFLFGTTVIKTLGSSVTCQGIPINFDHLNRL